MCHNIPAFDCRQGIKLWSAKKKSELRRLKMPMLHLLRIPAFLKQGEVN
jgi:hypothetical protein